MHVSRRNALGLIGAGVPLTAGVPLALTPQLSAAPLSAPLAQQSPAGSAPRVYDQIGLEWAMNILPFCSAPEAMGGEPMGDRASETAADKTAADGTRDVIWPIVGGTFEGRGPDGRAIRGTVIPGGGDFPVVRPDGVHIVDALYRLKTDDGVQIIIHNVGQRIADHTFRLLPTFNVPGKKYAWLRESVFVATLTYPIPPEIPAPDFGAKANGRLIQVFRMT